MSVIKSLQDGRSRKRSIVVYACFISFCLWQQLKVPFDISLSSSTNFTLEAREMSTIPRTKSSTQVDHLVHRRPTGRELPGNKIFLVGPWVTTNLLEHNVDYLSKDMEIHWFNHSSMARSVQLIDKELAEMENITGAWEAFRLFRPWAYRADLWRYMILWSEGGLYIDSKMRFEAPLHTWASLTANETLSCCEDMGAGSWISQLRNKSVPVLWNAVLSARKGSPILLEAIRMIIENSQSRSKAIIGEEYNIHATGHADLSVTGPMLLGYAATAEIVPKNSWRMPCKWQSQGVYFHGTKQELGPMVLKVGRNGTQKELGPMVLKVDSHEHAKVRNAGNKYGSLYTQNLIYCDAQPAALRQKYLVKNDHVVCNITSLLM